MAAQIFRKIPDAKSINFLDPINKESEMLTGAFVWIGTVGKNLLIIVELIVLVAFGARFFMDERSNDLTEEVNAQIAVLENDAWRQSSVRYGNLQNLLVDLKKIESGQQLNSSVISEILSNIPITLNIQSFSFNGTRASLALSTPNLNALKDYEDSLKNNSYYSDVKFNINKAGDELEVNVSFLINQDAL